MKLLHLLGVLGSQVIKYVVQTGGGGERGRLRLQLNTGAMDIPLPHLTQRCCKPRCGFVQGQKTSHIFQNMAATVTKERGDPGRQWDCAELGVSETVQEPRAMGGNLFIHGAKELSLTHSMCTFGANPNPAHSL